MARERLSYLPRVRQDRRREVRRILAGALGIIAGLSLIWAVTTDIEDPPAPLEPNDLYYGLSTIAQCAAALAAILGAFGLWRLDRLQELDRQDEDRAGQINQELLRDRVEKPAMEFYHQFGSTS